MKLDAPFTFSSLSERGIFLIRLLFSLNLLSKTFSSSWKLDHSRCQFEASFDSSYTIKNVLSLLLNNISNSKFENVTDPAHNLCSISRNNEIVIFCQNLMIFMWSVLDIKKTFQQLNWLLHETFSFAQLSCYLTNECVWSIEAIILIYSIIIDSMDTLQLPVGFGANNRFFFLKFHYGNPMRKLHSFIDNLIT